MESKSDIDEGLYSRQLYVLGHDAQRKMSVSSVLIAGLSGLGVEITKNVVLAGVKAVTLWDNVNTSYIDLASQFYLNEDLIGTNRAKASIGSIRALNPYVDISLLDIPSLNDSLASLLSYSVVVLVDQVYETQAIVSEFCHQNNIKVVICNTNGVYGKIFTDFGTDFICNDIDGETYPSSLIASITSDNPPLVTVLEETRHGLETGDKVLINDVQGFDNAINGKEFSVIVKDPFSFEINCDNLSQFGPYITGGTCTKSKKSVTLSFDSFVTSYNNPGSFVCDIFKYDKAEILHLLFKVLAIYAERNGSYPSAGNMSDANKFYSLVSEVNLDSKGYKLNEADISNNEKFIKQFSLCCQGYISPICALLGGIVGQEIIKACSGKFNPIKQWFYFDASETLPSEPLPLDEVTPCNSRYDGQIIIYGKSMQQKLHKLKMFLVGAGAIGCEMVKNWALMGISSTSSDGNGMIHVTDMDRIEKSNLSRQFLFRNSDIGQQKSTTAALAAKAMNGSLNIQSYEMKVATETESFFSDDFFESLDMVCTALDNVEARLYVDQRCLFYKKPLLESGTLGAKGHTQIVVPGKSEHYGASRDPPEKSIPMCTLKSFPNSIEHTLAWARDWFEEEFKQIPDNVNQYLNSKSIDDFMASSVMTQQNMKLDSVLKIKSSLVDQYPRTFSDCVVWARHCFEDKFVNQIKQLLFNFPKDKVTSAGTLFWSGAKKAPSPLQFDITDPLHLEFIHTCACSRAKIFGIPTEPISTIPLELYKDVIKSIKINEFVPSSGVKIAATEEESKSNATVAPVIMELDGQVQEVIRALPPIGSFGNNYSVVSIEFDKDIDEQMRLIAACSNLRARNYTIAEADLHKSRGIAGKIMPAIATTTALVTGMICLEIYKLLFNKELEQYRCSFTNLALPMFTASEPNPPNYKKSILKGKEWKWSQWDSLDIDNKSMTLKGLLDFMEAEYSLEVSMLSSGVSILYSNFMNKQKSKERQGMLLKDIVESVAKKSIPSNQRYLIFEVIVADCDTGDEVEIPYIRFKL